MERNKIVTRLRNADIYAITAEEYSVGRSNLEVVRQLLAADVSVIQYREKNKSAKVMYEECRKIRDMTRAAGAIFIVNDRVDLAMMVQADGIHIGQDDLPVAEVRKMVGERMIVGLSTHTPIEAQAAEQCRLVDYIGVGPVYATTTKQDIGQIAGLDYVAYIAKNITLPFVAIGGIKADNIEVVKRQGASTFAIISDLVSASDIGAKVRALRAKLLP